MKVIIYDNYQIKIKIISDILSPLYVVGVCKCLDMIIVNYL